MKFDKDNFLHLSWEQWQKFKNDPVMVFHPGTLNENYNKKLVKVFAPVCGGRPYIVENKTKKELLAYFIGDLP